MFVQATAVSTPDSGSTSRLRELYDSLVDLGYGVETGEWGTIWNRIKSAAEWTPSGDVTADDVKAGVTFYGSSRDQETGMLSLTGDANTDEVVSGKTFYTDDFNLQTGTLSLVGDATVGDVVNGKTFYGNSFDLLTGTAASPIDFSLQQFSEYDDYEGPGGNGEPQAEYQEDEAIWTNTSTNVWKDERTGLYWSNYIGDYTNLFPNQDHSSCDFFSSDPRGDYNGLDSDCGDAINACGTLSLDKNGDSIADDDWYLPSQVEALQSYVDGMFNKTGVTPEDAYNFTKDYYFWTSSEYSYGSGSAYAWYVVLSEGGSNDSHKSGSSSVHCVARD